MYYWQYICWMNLEKNLKSPGFNFFFFKILDFFTLNEPYANYAKLFQSSWRSKGITSLKTQKQGVSIDPKNGLDANDMPKWIFTCKLGERSELKTPNFESQICQGFSLNFWNRLVWDTVDIDDGMEIRADAVRASTNLPVVFLIPVSILLLLESMFPCLDNVYFNRTAATECPWNKW